MLAEFLTAFFTVLAVVGVVILVIAYDALAWGLVCYKFWYWFVLPVFSTLPQIAFWQAVGLMFFISLFKVQTQQIIKKEYREETTQVITAIILPWVALLTGYVTYALIIARLAH